MQVTNIGRDGVGGVMSCGQGSIWRVDVIRDGITAEGKKSVDPVEIRSVVGTKVSLRRRRRRRRRRRVIMMMMMYGDAEDSYDDGRLWSPLEDADGVAVACGACVQVGYSQLSRIEDTMTSIGLFAKGFKSVYVNEENEILGSCTQVRHATIMMIIMMMIMMMMMMMMMLMLMMMPRAQTLCETRADRPCLFRLQEPNSMDWRIKQLFRWHYGAVELFSMGPIKLQEGRFPSIWHRIYVWESCTYFFQAISAQIFLLMPIW
jgi:hypothetical protein